MNIYTIQTEDGPVFTLAKTMGDAIAKWRTWIIKQSEGELPTLNMNTYWPESITEIASKEDIIL